MADNLPAPAPEPTGEIILYQTEDGISCIEVRLEGDAVWLSQRGMADLFQTSVPNINQHLKTIYEDGELPPEATIKRYLIVQTEGRRQDQHFEQTLDDLEKLEQRRKALPKSDAPKKKRKPPRSGDAP